MISYILVMKKVEEFVLINSVINIQFLKFNAFCDQNTALKVSLSNRSSSAIASVEMV